MGRLGREGGWDWPAYPPLALLHAGSLPCPPPTSSHAHCSQAFPPHFPLPGLPHTLALGHTGGAIKVSACVSWTAGAEVLTEVRLIGAHGAADTAVDAGVVVVPRGALDCRQGGGAGVKMAGKQEFWGRDTFIIENKQKTPEFLLESQPSLIPAELKPRRKQTRQSGWLQCQSCSFRH